MMKRASRANVLEATRRATVRVCNESGEHRGQGLLLDLGNDGTVVLTCHHVVAGLEKSQLFVAIPNAKAELGKPQSAEYVEERSRPAMDAVVLRIKAPREDLFDERPWLYALNPRTYNGSLEVTGLTHLPPGRFFASVKASTVLNVAVKNRGPWPNPPERYTPAVFVLSNTSDAREGISGGIVLCEDGILGLTHFAREESAIAARENYLVPWTAWAEGWPELGNLIEPFVDKILARSAKLKRARELEVESDILISSHGFRPDVYLERHADAEARRALERFGGVIVIGKPHSGKSRLVLRVLQEHPERLVLLPLGGRKSPPDNFEASGFAGEEMAIVFDDLHSVALTSDPLEWRRRFEEATGKRCLLVCTSRDGQDWKRVKAQPQLKTLLEVLPGEAHVFVSKAGPQGDDLSEDEGFLLARDLGLNLSREEFRRRFDGSPGSLALDLKAMAERYEALKEDARLGILMSTALDAAKLLHAAGLPRFRLDVLGAAAKIIVGGPVGAQAWTMTLGRAEEEGFGRVNDVGDFKVYRPYIEECVDEVREPVLGKLEALVPVLTEIEDYEALNYIGTRLFFKYKSPAARDALDAAQKGGLAPYDTINFFTQAISIEEDPAVEKSIRDAIADGDKGAYQMLGHYLGKRPGREKEAEQAYRDAIAAGHKAYISLGTLLERQPGREGEAEEAFKKEIDSDTEATSQSLGNFHLGRLLSRQQGREEEAEQYFRKALTSRSDLLMALHIWRELGDLLARLPSRQQEAEQAYKDAIQSKDKDAHLSLAELLAKQPRREREAEQAFHDAVAADSDGAHALFGMFLYEKPGREAEVQEEAENAVKKGDDRGHYLLGLIAAHQKGREKEAEEAFRTAIAKGLKFAAYNLGMLLASQADREAEAEEACVLAIDAGITDAHLVLGDLLTKLAGREQDAEREFKAAIESGDKRGYLPLAWLIGRQPGREKETEEAIQNALQAGDGGAHFVHGIHLIAQPGRLEEGYQSLERAAAIGDKRAFRALGFVLANQAGREEEAEKRYMEAIAAGDRLAYGDLGDLLTRLPRRKKDAERAYKKAIKLGVTEAHLGLGRLLASQSSRRAEGIRVLRQAKAAGVEGADELLKQVVKD